MQLDQISLRLSAIEKELKENDKKSMSLYVSIQAIQQLLSSIYDYLSYKSVTDNNFDKDKIINEFKILFKECSDHEIELRADYCIRNFSTTTDEKK